MHLLTWGMLTQCEMIKLRKIVITLIIIWGSMASKVMNGVACSVNNKWTASSTYNTWSCSQLSKPSTTMTSRVCWPLKASKHWTISTRIPTSLFKACQQIIHRQFFLKIPLNYIFKKIPANILQLSMNEVSSRSFAVSSSAKRLMPTQYDSTCTNWQSSQHPRRLRWRWDKLEELPNPCSK